MTTKEKLLARRYPVYSGIRYAEQGKSMFAYPRTNIGAERDGLRWHEQPESAFRFDGYADEVYRREVPYGRAIDHRGWYNDEVGDWITRGIVLRLPHGRYIAGAQSTDDAPAARLDLHHVYTDARDAALAADELARIAAEHEREQEERRRAALRWSEARAELCELRAEHSDACKRGAIAAARRVREHAESTIANIRALVRDWGINTLREYA